ncbi:hypothetical protein [Baekduia sp. Peel2402]|uniref:hypothetical protein n=1 Tax=Baekduia sp. Peel2402 TaxID=3458296 RepID=UPI00403E3CCF
MTDLLHRIRWTNLARAFALLLAALLTFSLLRGKHHEPTLPPALTEPPAVVADGGASEMAESGEEEGERAAPSGDEPEAASDEVADGAPSDGEASEEADRADARRRAATRKAAKRRAARKATAERARKRRRTAARRRDASQVATGEGGTVERAWPTAAPAPAGAEFRP